MSLSTENPKRLCCVCPKEATLRCLLCDSDICFEHIKTHDAILNGDLPN